MRYIIVAAPLEKRPIYEAARTLADVCRLVDGLECSYRVSDTHTGTLLAISVRSGIFLADRLRKAYRRYGVDTMGKPVREAV